LGLNLKLCLGVNVVPELDSSANTFQVATWMEEKYSLFSKFAEIEADSIAIHLETYIEGEMENMLKFDVAPKQIHFIDKITKDFQDFIDLEKLAGVVPGVPTGAALKGTNRRLKLKHGPRRPSFQDTGTMEASLLTWIE